MLVTSKTIITTSKAIFYIHPKKQSHDCPFFLSFLIVNPRSNSIFPGLLDIAKAFRVCRVRKESMESSLLK